MSYFVGVDIGGTFTDCVVLDDAGAARLYKSPTTPAEPSAGVAAALALAEQGRQTARGDRALLAAAAA